MTVTQAELSGYNRRPKRFLGALLRAGAFVGTLFNIGMSSVNAVYMAQRTAQCLEPNLTDNWEISEQHNYNR